MAEPLTTPQPGAVSRDCPVKKSVMEEAKKVREEGQFGEEIAELRRLEGEGPEMDIEQQQVSRRPPPPPPPPPPTPPPPQPDRKSVV